MNSSETDEIWILGIAFHEGQSRAPAVRPCREVVGAAYRVGRYYFGGFLRSLGKMLRILIRIMDVPITPAVLAAWLALPVFVRDVPPVLEEARRQHGGDAFVDWFFDTVDPEKDQRVVSEFQVPTPRNAVEAAAALLGRIQLLDHANEARNKREAEVGALPKPSSEIPAVAMELAALASSSEELQDAGLASILIAAAEAMSVEHSPDPIAPDVRSRLRDAVDRMQEGMPRRWIGWAYGALSRRAAAAERPDLWQEEVAHLMSFATVRGGHCPSDLALLIAAVGASVVVRDSRWERAANSRHQLEELLDLAVVDSGDDFDQERLRLAIAYLKNYDLRSDEEAGDWFEILDRVALDLIGRLGYNGVNATLSELGNMLLSVTDHPERITELLGSWGRAAQEREMLDLDVASSMDAVIRRVLGDAGDPDISDNADNTGSSVGTAHPVNTVDLGEGRSVEEAVKENASTGAFLAGGASTARDSLDTASWGVSMGGYQASPEQSAQVERSLRCLRGVPEGLYSEDFEVRREALANEFGGWAFRCVLASEEEDFTDAIAACAEMYTRGIRDTAEVVQEESVIFARRIIFGLCHRHRGDEATPWARQVIADTMGKSTPRCVRARVQALLELSMWEEGEPEGAWAAQELGAMLENSHTDYAVCFRGEILEHQARKTPSGPQRIALMEQALELYVQAVDLEEWENTDWPELIRSAAVDLVDEYRLAGDAAGMVTNAGRYLEWLASPVTASSLHDLSYNVLRHLAAIPESVDAQTLVRRQSVYDRAARIREALPAPVQAFSDALDVMTGEIGLWRSDHSHPFGRMDAAVDSAMRIIHQAGIAEERGLTNGGMNNEAMLDTESVELVGRMGRHIVGVTISEEDAFSEVSAALLYLRHGLYRVDPKFSHTLNLLVMHAADPGGFHECKDHALVREVYERLEPLVDEARDGVHVPGFRRLAKNAARRGRGLFQK